LEYLRWIHGHSKSRACDSVPTGGEHCANFMFQKIRAWLLRGCSLLFQTSVTFRTRDLRKARPMVNLPIGGIRNVRERYQESSLPKMRGYDGIEDH
jgi:hypothetical protein